MTKQNIMAIVALITIGMTGAVYAETATVEIPFDSHGSTCTFDELSVEFHCVWQGFKEVYTLEDLENYKDLLTEERYDQEIQKLNEQALAEIAEEKAKLTEELKYNEGFLKSVQKKLRNERFVNNAPEQVIKMERQKEADALAKIETIKASLKSL